MTNLELVTKEAVSVFGSQEKAHKWLTSIHPTLKEKPVDYIKSKEEALVVMQILKSIEYGGVL